MSKTPSSSLYIPQGKIEQGIVTFRGKNVMLDFVLAELYGVETRTLNQAVKRNLERFPDDFMFQLSKEELDNWRSQIVTSNPSAKMSLRRRPYAFTEQGVAMLSSVLKSKRAAQVNVAIIRTFVRLREILSNHEELAERLQELEEKYERQFRVIFDAIRDLMDIRSEPKDKIGYHTISKV